MSRKKPGSSALANASAVLKPNAEKRLVAAPPITQLCQEKALWRNALRHIGVRNAALPELWKRLGKDWPGKVLAARKWQDKKVLLDKLLSVTAGRRLAAADYSEVRGRACVRLSGMWCTRDPTRVARLCCCMRLFRSSLP